MVSFQHLAQPPTLSTTTCRLPAITYSVYRQLPSISGGRSSNPQSENASCRGNMDTLTR